jgi:uncharacterized heparinase superfamily protein
VRSTAAHNTVSVAGQEQSEVWATFRVARRARAKLHEFGKTGDTTLAFVGSHDGFKRLSPSVEHRRDIQVVIGEQWEIVDHILGGGDCSAMSYIHLHPDIELTEQSGSVWMLSRSGHPIARISVTDGADVVVQTQQYCPEFGVKRAHPVLALASAGPLPLKISYLIEKLI